MIGDMARAIAQVAEEGLEGARFSSVKAPFPITMVQNLVQCRTIYFGS